MIGLFWCITRLEYSDEPLVIVCADRMRVFRNSANQCRCALEATSVSICTHSNKRLITITNHGLTDEQVGGAIWNITPYRGLIVCHRPNLYCLLIQLLINE